MNPIINPWIFYLLEKANFIKEVSFYVLITFVTIWAVSFISEGEHCNDRDNTKYERAQKNKKTSIKCIIISLIILLITPSSSTIQKMMIAQNVTPNNLRAVGETVEYSIDYIFEKINEVVDNIDTEKEQGDGYEIHGK